MYVGVAILSACPLFLGARSIPRILQASLALSIVGLVVILCLLLGMRKQSQPWSFITNVHGNSGWGVKTAWMLGLGNSMYAFSSTDAAIHIAEEMIHPERRLPQVLNMTLAIGFATSFPLLLVMMLSMNDTDAVVGSTLPYAELFQQVTNNKAATTFMMCWITLVLFSALIGQWVTCGRLAWAFARDGGLPYSDFFAHVSHRHAFPVRTTLLALAFCCCYGLLYLISTTAFNSIITSAVLFSNITYCIPQAIVGVRGRKNVLPDHSFDLGRLGYICNVMSPVFVIFLGVLICFPPELPVTTQNINFTPVILVGCYLTIVGFWFVAGKRFEGPKIDWETDDQVGAAIRDSAIERKELFITTKFWPHWGAPENVEKCLDKGSFHPTWRAIQAIVAIGKVRAVDVSNFNIQQLQEALSAGGSVPLSCNQVEARPWFSNTTLLDFMKQHQILRAVFCPFAGQKKGGVPLVLNPLVQQLASKNAMGVGQLLQSWAVQRGTIPLGKSQTPGLSYCQLHLED
ncbi:MAG: hypothetical protein Q9217_004266 [Psora testacea]